MKTLLTNLVLPLIVLTLAHTASAQKDGHKIKWSVAADLPRHEDGTPAGLAGVFTGVNNNVLLMAGGANFPNGTPWNGGEKKYWDAVLVLEKSRNGKFAWVNAKTRHLKQAIAYGASTTIADGVVCAGGETAQSGISKEVFIMQWDAVAKDVLFRDLPSLPIPLANACITSIGKTIYIAGGETTGSVSAGFFMLDLGAAHPQWETLPPMPVAMSHSVAVTQSNGSYPCVYVMGGRSATASGISELHNTALCFDPQIKQWKTLHPIGDGKETTTLSAGTGVSIGTNNILLIGGDKGNLFHKIETFNADIAKAATEAGKQQLQKEKLELLNNHPGFSKDVYLYNTVDDSWYRIGELPFYGQVTTTAVKWGNDIFIPSGEIKPGVRVPVVTMGKIPPQKR